MERESGKCQLLTGLLIGSLTHQETSYRDHWKEKGASKKLDNVYKLVPLTILFSIDMLDIEIIHNVEIG